MVSETIQHQYIIGQLRNGLRKVFEKQAQAARTRVNSSRHKARAQAIANALAHPVLKVSAVSGGVHANISYPLEMRFRDMKRYGGAKIYNRILWPNFYGSILQDVKFEFREWHNKTFGTQLTEALEPLTTISQ